MRQKDSKGRLVVPPSLSSIHEDSDSPIATKPEYKNKFRNLKKDQSSTETSKRTSKKLSVHFQDQKPALLPKPPKQSFPVISPIQSQTREFSPNVTLKTASTKIIKSFSFLSPKKDVQTPTWKPPRNIAKKAEISSTLPKSKPTYGGAMQKPEVPRIPVSPDRSPTVSPTCMYGSPTHWQCRLSDSEGSSDDDSPGRKESFSLVTPAVQRIVDNLGKNWKKRVHNEVTEEVKNIHQRVKQALENSDFDVGLEDEGLKLPPLEFDTRNRREMMKNRNNLLEKLNNYEKDCKLREQIMSELDVWIGSAQLPDIPVSEDKMAPLVNGFQDIYDDVMEGLDIYSDASEKVINVGKHLLKETGAIIKENEANAKRLRDKLKDKNFVIYDDRQLLADQIKWDNAVKMILGTFEDAIKWTKNNMYKIAYGKSQKQFKYLMSAVSKRQQELTEKRRSLEEITRKLNSTKTSLERHTKEIENLRVQLSKANMEIQEKTQGILRAEDKCRTTEQKLREAEDKYRDLREEIDNKPPTPLLTPDIVEVIKIDSTTEMELQKAVAELEETKKTMAELNSRIDELEKQAATDKDEIIRLTQELAEAEEALKNAETNEVDDGRVSPELNLPKDIESSDIGYYKTLLAGIRKEFTDEIEKLKAHHKKDKLRSEADRRRNQTVHKEQLNTIQRDVLRVLRAIVHFKDYIQSIMEKENLGDQAAALDKLESLVPEKLLPDPRELLALLVGKVVDYLHNMEEIVTTAFLAMRLMIRGSIPKPPSTPTPTPVLPKKIVKEVEVKIRTIEKAKEQTNVFAKRLKKAKRTLKSFEEETPLEIADKKYLDLIKRYGMVWKMYAKLQKDMLQLQEDFQTKLEEETEERETIFVKKMKFELKERRAMHEQELKLNINDQRENLKILDRAYEENKISKDLHTMTSSLLRKAMEIPRKRFRYMIEKYVAVNDLQETKDRVEDILTDDSVNPEVRQELKTYVKRVDLKINNKMGAWQREMNSVEDERRHLFGVIWRTFNEILAETGLLLIHPLFKAAGDRATVYNNMAHTINRDKMKKMLKKRRRYIADMMSLPTAITGTTINVQTREHPLWDAEISSGGQAGKIDTPYTMSYDIHKPKIVAKREIGKCIKTPYPLASTQNYSISMESIKKISFESLNKIQPIKC